MSAVDGTPLGGRVRLLAEAQDVIVAYARHRNIESLTDAASRYILEFAPLVEDRASLPVSPGDGREGAATATAAPSVLTLAESKSLHPSSRFKLAPPHVHLDDGPCVFGHRCDQ